MHGQNEKSNKETETIQKTKMKTDILQLKNTTKLKNSIDSFKSRLDYTEERISDLENRTFKIIKSGDQIKMTEE